MNYLNNILKFTLAIALLVPTFVIVEIKKMVQVDM
jgi:hypothetical protein